MYNYGGGGTWANPQAAASGYSYAYPVQQTAAHVQQTAAHAPAAPQQTYAAAGSYSTTSYAASVPKPPAAPYNPPPMPKPPAAPPSQPQTHGSWAKSQSQASSYSGGSGGSGYSQTASNQAPGGYQPSRTGNTTTASGGSGQLSGSLANNFVSAGAAKKGATQSVSGGTSYTGYDAAVYAAATNYLQNKSRSGNMNTWSKSTGSSGSSAQKTYGGGGSSAGLAGFTSRTQQKRTSYSKFGGFGSQQEKLQAMQEHYCEVCKISCLGPQTYQAHISGTKHKKKEEAQKRGTSNVSLPSGRNSYKCEVCDVTCASMDTFNAHVRGKNHQKTVRLLQQLGKPVADASSATVIPPKGGVVTEAPVKKVVAVSKINFVGGKDLVSSANGSGGAAEKEPEMVGQDYIESKIDDHGHTVYYCKLCACDIIDAVARDMHLKGRRHRLAFKRKVDPTLEVEIKQSYYAGNKYSYKNRKQEEALRKELMRLRHQEMASLRMSYESEMDSLMATRQTMLGRSPFPVHDHVPLSMVDNQFRLDLLEDKHVMQKHRDIYPTEHELTAVQRVVNHAEQALKGVSDAIEEEVKAALPADADPGQAHERLLKGVMRVGDLAKGLLLKGEINITIVLLCSAKPTKALLKKLFEKTQEQLKKMDMSETYAVQMNMSNGSISIVTKKQGKPKEPPAKAAGAGDAAPAKENAGKTLIPEPEYVPVSLDILVTSVLVREATEGAEGGTDPQDMLPREKCLAALAALRQAKWFQARCVQVQSAVLILRVLRDLCKRVPTWTPLSPWALELLVEKVVSTAPVQLSVGEVFRRVFGAVSAGVLLPTGPGLLDPCEKEAVDAVATMNPQQREDITASAQHALRLIAFGQIHEVLGIEAPAKPADRKRPHEAGEKKAELKVPKKEPDTAAGKK